MDELQLLAALANDLDGSFEALVRAHQDRIFSIALRLLGDRAEAEDAAQDALVRAYRALGGWDGTRIRELRLGAWLATITVNVVRNRWRRSAAGTATPLAFLDELDHPAVAAPETPPERTLRRELTEAWAARLMALPERYRAPIVLRHVDGLGYGEIALALDRPAGTVKAQVHRGLALLRAALEAEARPGAASPPTVAAALVAVAGPSARGPTGGPTRNPSPAVAAGDAGPADDPPDPLPRLPEVPR